MKNKLYFTSLTGLVLLLLAAFCSSSALAGQSFLPPDKIKYPPLEFSIPQAEKIRLENGTVLFFVENRELPLVSISAMLRAGSLYDPPGKEGLAELVASVMLTGGTARLTSREVDERLDFLAASPSITMSLDVAAINFSFLKSDLPDCLDILSQIMRTPVFEEEKLSLAISLKQEDLRRIADNQQRLAFREFNRLLYPEDPRGRYATSDSLKKIIRSDLTAFHQEYFFPANISMAISGDISREEAISMINQYFGNWTSNRPAIKIALAPKETGNGSYIIQKSLPQSAIVTGHLTVSKKEPDYYAFSLLDFIVGGGGFNSRIFNAVRNNEGLAYNAGSFYRARPNYGVFGAYAFTKTASTLQALDLIKKIIKDVSSASVSSEELNGAVKSVINNFIFSFEKPEDVASLHMAADFEDLPADFVSGYREKIEKLTDVDLRRAAAKYLKNIKTLTVIVGDAERLGDFSPANEKPVLISPIF